MRDGMECFSTSGFTDIPRVFAFLSDGINTLGREGTAELELLHAFDPKAFFGVV